ncbi:Solute carrier family 12 member 6 [Orchesella cincta]|uniref:Solute carrier family 12 member 6 n=1 Tax=Orchesella cincta TaxID=48709 RepID=A0A1D2M9X2_ORCCI|nr:Solute carrier family 12 member 6 [Orchesella cincta]
MARNSGNKTNVQSVLHQLYGGDESTGRVPLPSVLHSFVSYSNTIPAAGTDAEGTTPKTGANMGTFIGVYLPCIQNIFGVILFIRLTWIVGTAGAFCAFLVVLLCCSITMLTAISMSAIATNGVVPAGGAYYMISRSLGPEFGGAVGILFYIGTTLAGSMYIVGAIEILITYMAPSITLFGDVDVPENMYNNYRVFGTALLLVLGLVVYFGVKLVNKFAAVALACVICSILAIYIGLFVNFNGNEQLPMCVLGNRLLQQVNGTCSKESSSALHKEFCPFGAMCDSYFQTHNVSIVNGIQGLSSGVFLDNMWPSFMEINHVLTKWDSSESDMVFPSATTNKQVVTDITTSFAILVGIFFPSVTGIMAGSNRSGDLADAQKSIPAGTIGAILTTSLVYLSSIFLFAGTVDNLLLRDKFGQSIGGHLVLGHIAWPNERVILIGAFLSTIGAGLQSLTGAPRLLQAIARDGVIPILEPFCASSLKGEPTRALLLTLVICECGVLLGNVDYLAPLLSMFFLMCYGFVNLACALQTLLKTPSWRPRFKYYHWSLSSLGMILCLTVMFMTSWYYALIAMGIAGIIYKHIEYRGAEKEWGDGIVGLNLSAASFSLLHLEEAPSHTKNWRPQIMILVKFPFENDSKRRKLFAFASQLKAGKGLTVATTVLEKDLVSGEAEALEAKQQLKKMMDEERVKGFVEVLCSPDIMIGMHLI